MQQRLLQINKSSLISVGKFTLALCLFTLVTFASNSRVMAVCNPYDVTTGCPASSPNQCPNANTVCCTDIAECSFPTLPSGCDPGSGFIPLGDCLKLSDNTKVSDTYTTPAFLVNLLMRNIFVAAGVVLFFMILLAGFQFVAGGKKGAENAKQIATATAIGFALMFSAYWIVQIVKLLTKTNIIL